MPRQRNVLCSAEEKGWSSVYLSSAKYHSLRQVEVMSWCDEYLTHKEYWGTNWSSMDEDAKYIIQFGCANDAILFKLKWM